MFKRSLFLLMALALLATLPSAAYDFHHWRTDMSHVFGSSIRQQTTNGAFNPYESITDAGASSYTIFWQNERQENGGTLQAPPNPPGDVVFGELPPTQPIRDNREEDDEVDWYLWGPVREKLTAAPATLALRPLFTPNVPQAWNPVVVDLDSSGNNPDHALIAVTLEQMRPGGVMGPGGSARNGRVQNREQVLNCYYPQTSRGLPGNNNNDPNIQAQDLGTVRPYWVRNGDPQTPGLRIRDLEPVRNSLNPSDPGVGVVTQPPIFARVPAVYRNDTGGLVTEVLPVVYLVVGTGENGDFAKVICIALQKPSTQRDPTQMNFNALDSLPPPLPATTVPATAPPPDEDFFNPNNGSGGQVMWSYTVESRTGGATPTPVAGISFANIGGTQDSRPVLLLTTADGRVICLNAKAADVRLIEEDGDHAILPVDDPKERWVWETSSVTPTSGPLSGMPFLPGFAYGMAPAVARVPLAGAFGSLASDESVNTVANALAKGVSEWMVFVADTYGTFWAFDAPGHSNTDAAGKLLDWTQVSGEERWKDLPGTTPQAGDQFRLDARGQPERFIVPPIVYQGNTPVRASNGALVSGSADFGADDEVIFAAERGNVYALDAMGELRVDKMNAANDGDPTGRTQTRWKFPDDDTTFAGAATEEPRVWPRELEDPFSTYFDSTNGRAADPYGNTYGTVGGRLGLPVASDDRYFSRGPLGMALGADTNPDGGNPNLDPGDDYVYVPYMQEQPATVLQYGPPGTTRTLTRPTNYRWFYEYLGSLKPYGFIQLSRPVLSIVKMEVTLAGDTVEIPKNRVQVGTIKSNGLPSNRAPEMLPVGGANGPANPNYDPAGPAVEDTLYFSDPSWYDDTEKKWYELPLSQGPGNPRVKITIEYVPPKSPTDSTADNAVTETLDYPSCFRSEPDPTDPLDPTKFTVVRTVASLTADRNRLEQRRFRRGRTAGPMNLPPAIPASLFDEDPAYVPSAMTYAAALPILLPPAMGDLFQNSVGEGWRQPGVFASGSSNQSGTLLAPSLYRGRIVAFTHRLRTQRVLAGCTDPRALSTAGAPARPYGPSSPAPANNSPRVPDPASRWWTYDPGVLHDDGSGSGPFVEDEPFATDVGGSITMVDGWAYVMYRNGHLRGYANVGGGAGGTQYYPPLIEQLPGEPANNGTLVEAPQIYLLAKVNAGRPVPTANINQILDQTGATPAIRPDVSPLHSVVGLDRSVMLEYGQTLFVAVDYGPASLLADPQSIDPNDQYREIDAQVMLAGNEVQGQIRSSNGAVQQLPGINRGVLPLRVSNVNWAGNGTHIMAILQVFTGLPSQSNPLTPGTPVLWERQPTGPNSGQFRDFQGELTYDIQVTQQGVQWRWPDDMTNWTSNSTNTDKQHYWETERSNSGARFNDTGGTTDNGPPLPAGNPTNTKWTWTNAQREWAPLLSYNNPLSVYYDPVPANNAVEGMYGASAPVNTMTLVDEYTSITDPGRKNGDPYVATNGMGGTVPGSRSGGGRPVVPVVGVGVRTPGGGNTWSQQLLFGDHGKTTPVSTTRYPDVAKLRVADRSYLGLVGRSLPIRIQRAPLTKMGKGADYGARMANGSLNPILRNMAGPGAPAGSLEQNRDIWDDDASGLYASIAESALKVTKLGTAQDLSAAPTPVPGRNPDPAAILTNGGLPAVGDMETLAVQVDVPLYTPDDIYSTRWRSSVAAVPNPFDPTKSMTGAPPTSAFNPFFPFPAHFSQSFPGANEQGRALWDRAERYSRSPEPATDVNPAERTALQARGEDVLSPYEQQQNDRTRRTVLFVDANGNGQLDLLPTYREAYRTFAVQVVVRPEMKLESADAQLDLGNVWHGKRQPGMDADQDPNTNRHLEIREWQRMKAMEGGNASERAFAAFWNQYWRPFNILNTGNVNLAYLKPEVLFSVVGTPVANHRPIALAAAGLDPWRSLGLANRNGPQGADPLQLFLRTSFDDQLLPVAATPAVPYAAAGRGIWLQKAAVGAGAPSAATYAETAPENTGGNALRRDPSVAGRPREMALSLNVPTGAALGTYTGTVRFYNDRAVAFSEEQDNPNGASTPTVGYRYGSPAGAVPGSATLDRQPLATGDTLPLEPVSDPPVGLRLRVIENMVHGRTVPSNPANPFGTALDPMTGASIPDGNVARRSMQPAAIPDLNFQDNFGSIARFILAFASNNAGLTAGQPGMYDVYGSHMLADSARGLFPFDAHSLFRVPNYASHLEPWAEFNSTTTTGTAGPPLFSNVVGAGGNTSVTRPTLSQASYTSDRTAVLSWTQRRSLGQGNEQHGVVYQVVSTRPGMGSPSVQPGTPVLMGPGGQLPDLRTQRSGVRMVQGYSNIGPTILPFWFSLYTANAGARRNLTFSMSMDPFNPSNLRPITLAGWPAQLATDWTPETTLPGTTSLSTVNDPHLFFTQPTQRTAALPTYPQDPAYLTRDISHQWLPNMAWVSFTGANQRLGRSDVYLSRYRTWSLVESNQRGGRDWLSKEEDYGMSRFPRFEAFDNNGRALGGDLLQADARRIVYTASGANWLIHPTPNFKVQFYLVQPGVAAGTLGSATNPLPLLDDPSTGTQTPEGEFVLPLAAGLANQPGLRNYRIMLDTAAGVVRLTSDARTLARLALGLGGADTSRPDPRIYADYTPATLRLTKGEVSASDPVIIPVLAHRGIRTFDASWYKQQTTANAWNQGQPVPGQVDRLYVLWRRSASAGSPGPACIYKVLRPGIQVRSTNPDTGTGFIRGLAGFSATVAPEEVNPGLGQVYFPYAMEGQRVSVTYVDFYGQSHTEQHVVRWLEEAPETVVPMETSVNEGSLDAFATFEAVDMGVNAPVRKLERIWLFWSSTRGSAGDLFFATISPRIGPDANVGNSIVYNSQGPSMLSGVSANTARQQLAARARYEKSRPFTLPPVLRSFLPATEPLRQTPPPQRGAAPGAR